MNFLFSHRNSPGQFKHILKELSKDSSNRIVFLTERNNIEIPGVEIILYKLKREVPKNCHKYLKQYEESIIHGQAAAEKLIELKNKGFIPDVIYAHGWGNSMFFKDIFSDVPLINYCEWYYNSTGADVGFDGKAVNYDNMARLRCNNSQFLQDLVSCNFGISPTEWQKSRFPKIFQDKIKVLHDGIGTDYFKPNYNAVFNVPNTDIKLTKDDEILTYATRGMEPYRGFPQFMEAVEILLKKRPNLKVLIAGEDRVCYGSKLKNETYKELMLRKLDLDLSRVHFVGGLPYNEYLKLLQISSVHCYLTYPFVLSWSFLEAMSVGCCIVGSRTQPVEEIMKDGYNGLLSDFYNKQELINKIEFALNNQDKMQVLRENARKAIVEKYDLKKLLPKHIEFIKETANSSDTKQYVN